jgi:hypothetical protein
MEINSITLYNIVQIAGITPATKTRVYFLNFMGNFKNVIIGSVLFNVASIAHLCLIEIDQKYMEISKKLHIPLLTLKRLCSNSPVIGFIDPKVAAV